jgi:hypothetical protein
VNCLFIQGVSPTDYEYYLAHQILPPIKRLCDPIERTDRARLAECLGRCLHPPSHAMRAYLDTMQGLDPGRYLSTTITDTDERRFSVLESQLPDSKRYKDAVPFVVRCGASECSVGFAPVANRAVRLSPKRSTKCFLDPHGHISSRSRWSRPREPRALCAIEAFKQRACKSSWNARSRSTFIGTTRAGPSVTTRLVEIARSVEVVVERLLGSARGWCVQ